ncbi:hypothetical protein HT031_003511 [Scenedesmus sp. PABB004]|nr:hypothetical protein HT031_003511 [Scenedesmus sp. PABB004]
MQAHASAPGLGQAPAPRGGPGAPRAAAPRGPRPGVPAPAPRWRVAGSNGAEGASARVEEHKQREIARMLLTTQKNMLALNNSRVKVQEELAVANRRIQDLEREVERLRTEHAAAAQALTEARMAAPPQQAPGGSRTGSPAPPQQYGGGPPPQQQQQVQQQQQQQMQQQQPPQAQAPQQPAPPTTITLTYVSGWHNVYIHYTVDGKSWTNVPGKQLTPVEGEHNTKTITIEGTALEFVMNNGDNDWDSPGRFADKPKNYMIAAPGRYRLRSGKLEREA